MLVAAIATSLWYAAPTRALYIDITDSDGSTLDTGTTGSEYTFRVTVNIEDNELLPVKSIDL